MSSDYPTVRDIVCLVSDETRVDPQYIVGHSRVPRIARARQMVMFLAREHTDKSYLRIAQALDRDHSTVMHGVRKISGLSCVDEELADQLGKIKIRIHKGVRSKGALSSADPLQLIKNAQPDLPRPALMRHRHLYHYGKPKSETPKKERKCLGCGETFISSGPGNRMCWCCRSDAKNLGLPEHYVGTVT